MATTLPPVATLEDLDRLPDDGHRYELLEGELIALPPPMPEHADVAHNIQEDLIPVVRKSRLGRVYIELGFKLFKDERTWLIPDVSFVRAQRRLTRRKGEYFEGAPDLAVEVVSPSESARDVQRKVEAYFAAGAKLVWVVYQDPPRIYVYHSPTQCEILGPGDTISAPELFPGWQCPVAKLFEE